jgi:hypothetical protein
VLGLESGSFLFIFSHFSAKLERLPNALSSCPAVSDKKRRFITLAPGSGSRLATILGMDSLSGRFSDEQNSGPKNNK